MTSETRFLLLSLFSLRHINIRQHIAITFMLLSCVLIVTFLQTNPTPSGMVMVMSSTQLSTHMVLSLADDELLGLDPGAMAETVMTFVDNLDTVIGDMMPSGTSMDMSKLLTPPPPPPPPNKKCIKMQSSRLEQNKKRLLKRMPPNVLIYYLLCNWRRYIEH